MGLSKNSVIASSFYISPPPGPTPSDPAGDKRKQVKINEVSNISVIPNYFSSGEEEQPHPNAQRVIHQYSENEADREEASEEEEDSELEDEPEAVRPRSDLLQPPQPTGQETQSSPLGNMLVNKKRRMRGSPDRTQPYEAPVQEQRSEDTQQREAFAVLERENVYSRLADEECGMLKCLVQRSDPTIRAAIDTFFITEERSLFLHTIKSICQNLLNS